MALVNDPNFTGLAKELYQHALISPLGPGGADPAKNAPAYIDKMQFAEALLDDHGPLRRNAGGRRAGAGA